MSFKLKPSYDISPISVYQVPFTPDNIPNDNGLVAKANDNSTIIIDKNIKKGSPLEKNALAHEGHHIKDMQDNKLAYDSENVYEDLSGGGPKAHSRKNFTESDRSLPWEKDAYKAGDEGKQEDLRPNPEKLDGPPDMQPETPIAFKVMGSRHKAGRAADNEKVSAEENFAMYSPLKKWGGPSVFEGGPGDDPKKELKKQAEENAKAELEKLEYQKEVLKDGNTRFYKSASASASGTDNVVVGSKAKLGQKQATDGNAYIQKLLNQGKTREEVMEGSLVSSSFYNLFPSSKETATVSDEYIEKKKITPNITITTSGGDGGGSGGSGGSGKRNKGGFKRKVKRAIQNAKATCKQGFFKKGGKCRRKTEGKRSKITKFKKNR